MSMDWITITLLLLFGIALIIVEIIFIPGTTVVGLVGGACVVFGVMTGYSVYGSQIGTFILIGTIILGGSLTFMAFKTGVWKKFSLKGSIDSKVNEEVDTSFLQGMEGITLSSLRPYGKADFGGRVFEVKTLGNYLKTGTKIRVTRIDNDNKIYVEPIN